MDLLKLPYKCNNKVCHDAIESKFKLYLFIAYIINFVTTVLIKFI